MFHSNIGYVRTPYVVRMDDIQMSEQVRHTIVHPVTIAEALHRIDGPNIHKRHHTHNLKIPVRLALKWLITCCEEAPKRSIALQW